MTTNEAVDVMAKVLAPYIGDTMARSATAATARSWASRPKR